ncbi:MAG: serine/threonine-protein kinase, partial [Planctomycetota bacterium]
MTRDEGPTLDMPSGDDSENPNDPSRGSGSASGFGSGGGQAGDGDETYALGPDDLPQGSAGGSDGPPPASTVRLDRGGEPESLGGTQVGPFRVLSVLGEGGFGVVYLAEQTEPVRRRVAMKVIKPGMDSRAVVARFEAERQALAVMDHPCIARVFDAGQTPMGRPYFVMEFVRGVPLTDFVSKHKLGLEQRLKLFRRVCEAVQHAHSKGIIHRDLKPSNILVEYEDGQATPKIIDFGVAKALDQRLTEKTIFTEQGQILGTPEYMSPEQAEMSGLDIDTRTDIYALGVVLYELLTGQLPFDPRSLRSAGYAEIQRIIREVEPQKPSTKLSTAGAGVGGDRGATRPLRDAAMDSRDLTRRLRRDLDWVVMKCLEKNRERRYTTAMELAAEVDRYLKFEPVQAGPPSVGYKLAKFVRRRRAFVVSAALVALAIAVGVAGLAVGLTREAAARERAEIAAAEARQLA